MNVGAFLALATAKLQKAGIGSARLDSLILLEEVLGKDRSYILAHLDQPLSGRQLGRLNQRLDRRSSHEPLAYIRGWSEFYGRIFKINKRVLEPRPESETMIDLLKKLALPAKTKIADIGTGSGCLGITAALEITASTVDLYDIDSAALAVARHNAHLHELTVGVHKRDLLNRPARDYDVILANLPYIPSHWRLHPSILMEPRIAFLGGKDGLDLYRRMFAQAAGRPRPPKFILTESMPPQHRGLEKIANGSSYQKQSSKDFIQVFELR